MGRHERIVSYPQITARFAPLFHELSTSLCLVLAVEACTLILISGEETGVAAPAFAPHPSGQGSDQHVIV